MRLFLSLVFLIGLCCPTVAQSQAAAKKHAVLLIGEDEYQTWETLPEFARTELEPRGFRTTIIIEDSVQKHQFPEIIPALKTADVLILSTRRRTPPKEQLDSIRAFIESGKPVVGIRTASH